MAIGQKFIMITVTKLLIVDIYVFATGVLYPDVVVLQLLVSASYLLFIHYCSAQKTHTI